MQINNSNVFSHRMHSHWKRRMGKVNKLTTNRLTIRNFLSDDTEKCLEGWGRDAGLGKYIIGYPMDYSSMDNFVCALAENKNAWVIEEKGSGKCIGYITMDIPYEMLEIAEIGYVIGEKYHHKGYAFEAVNKIIEYYLNDKNMYMIEAKYNSDNEPSGRLLEKLGFRKDGILRERRIDMMTGNRKDLVICSIKKPEFGK